MGLAKDGHHKSGFARGMELLAAWVKETGAAGVLFKPFQPEDLARRVRELCQ